MGLLKFNRFGLMSFYSKDHGYRDQRSIDQWVDDVFTTCGQKKPDGDVMMIALPRIFGYVFNPVSFFYCYDKSETLRAVICEVNNTFGETHSYLCLAGDNGFDNGDFIKSDKIFHVSPFIERQGSYQFRFQDLTDKLGIWINHLDHKNEMLLLTSLTGNFAPLNTENVNKAFWRYPLVTFKAIVLIHWQAVKLVLKGIKYIRKPIQLKTRISKTH